MEVTLLTKDQVCGENALDVMKDDDLRKASLSDLALLLGGCQIFDNKSGDSKYTGWYWVNSVNENGLNEKMCGCIACSGEYMLAIPRSRTDSIRPVLSPKVTASLKPRAVKNGGVLKGVPVVLYGEFPQSIASNSDELDMVFRQNGFRMTGKKYQFDSVRMDELGERPSYQPREYPEYDYMGKRYIRIRPTRVWDMDDDGRYLSNNKYIEPNKTYWVKVEPIEWLKDKSGYWIAKQGLMAGMQFDRRKEYTVSFEKTDMYQRLKEFSKAIKRVRLPRETRNLNEVKARILANRDLYRAMRKTVSGVVVADKIAEGLQSGLIRETVTPSVGKQLSDGIKRAYILGKKQKV